MTVVSLFDVLARAAPPARQAAGGEHQRLLARFAARLIGDSLADLERLREIEQQFVSSPRDDLGQELEVRRTVWQLYSDWAHEAEQALERARSWTDVASDGREIDALDTAIGKVQARLTVKPEQTAQAIDNARKGRVKPAKELRDELHARLRA